MSVIYPYFFALSRWVMPMLTVVIIYLWLSCFIKNKKEPSLLAELVTKDGIALPLYAMEIIIGRGKNADLIIPVNGVEKRHALLCFEKGHWHIVPIMGKVAVNLQNASRKAPLEYGDKITLAGQTLTFRYKEDENILSKRPPSGGLALVFLSAFQIILGAQICLNFWEGLEPLIPASFLLLIVGQWTYFLVGQNIKNFKMLIEIPALYLITLGLSVVSSLAPEELLKQIICFGVGFVGFILLTFILKYRGFVIKAQRVVMVLSLALLYYTAFFGTKINSARNWLSIGPFSFQPSEIVKVAFVAMGGISLYIITKKPAQRLEFLIYSLLSMGALAIMLDFGAVAIFFVIMLTALTLRLESPLVISGIFGAAVVGAGGIILLYPYVARRFGAWLQAWQYADSLGYQQTRTMMSFASGGMLGVGAGNGNLKNIAAAETDLVFGVLGEEFGAIIALAAALSVVALGIYGFRLIKNSTCLFDAVTVGGATVQILFQTALNIFGSVDILPLTGVTFVFVSLGGSSLISALMMLSFFKAAELHKQSSKQWRGSE